MQVYIRNQWSKWDIDILCNYMKTANLLWVSIPPFPSRASKWIDPRFVFPCSTVPALLEITKLRSWFSPDLPGWEQNYDNLCHNQLMTRKLQLILLSFFTQGKCRFYRWSGTVAVFFPWALRSQIPTAFSPSWGMSWHLIRCIAAKWFVSSPLFACRGLLPSPGYRLHKSYAEVT
jgi:hypothetical protein